MVILYSLTQANLSFSKLLDEKRFNGKFNILYCAKEVSMYQVLLEAKFVVLGCYVHTPPCASAVPSYCVIICRFNMHACIYFC